jgi:putative acyl-CoA dehydrogenase
MCLDVLRATARSPDAARAALAAELEPAMGLDPRFADYAGRLLDDLPGACPDEYGARRLAERIVIAVQAALLLRHAPGFVAEAFVASRVASEVGGAYGRLGAGADCEAILERALRT